MNFLIFLSALISCTLAGPYLYPVPLQQLQAPLLVVKTARQAASLRQPQQEEEVQQYFTQDTLGQYSYGYIEPLSAKQEIRTLDGVTSGSYSYIDANGRVQTVDYTADDDGFHVAATNLPQINHAAPKPVEDTAEVIAAREQHLAAHRAIRAGNPLASSILPKPVEDTVEVAEAKRKFFAIYSAELEKQKLLKEAAVLRNQSIIGPVALRSSQHLLEGFKSKSDIANFVARKTSRLSDIGAFTYGYHVKSPIKRTHYYLPLV